MRGVTSDIILPDNLEFLEVREQHNPDALPWDEIGKANYHHWPAGYDLKTIQQLSQQRLEQDNTFRMIHETTEWLSKQNDKQYPLQIDEFRKEKKAIQASIKQLESLMKLKSEIDVTALPKEVDRWSDDVTKKERFDQWLKNLKQDIYLDQAVKVMNDMISQQNLAKTKQSEEPARKAF